jgi:hypothetical protein
MYEAVRVQLGQVRRVGVDSGEGGVCGGVQGRMDRVRVSRVILGGVFDGVVLVGKRIGLLERRRWWGGIVTRTGLVVVC